MGQISPRLRSRLIAASAAVLLVAGCGGGEAPAAGGSAPADWTASPGQLDKVTAVVRAKQYACSDLEGTPYRFRVCSHSRRSTAKDSDGAYYWTRSSVKLVAAPDGTVIQVAFPDARGDSDVVALVAPHVFGEDDAAILAADGTTLDWGAVRQLKDDGHEKLLLATIKGLRDPAQPPPPRLGLSKEQILLALRADRSWDCELDDGLRTPDPDELSKVTARPHLDCDTRPYNESQGAELVLADEGSGVDDLRFSATHPGLPPAAGTMLIARLQTVWSAFGDLGQVRAEVERHLSSGAGLIAYVNGWKLLVDVRPAKVGGRYSETTVTGYTTSVRMLPERPSLLDPAE